MAQKRSTPPDKPGRGRSLPVPHGYADFLRDLKERIRNAQIKAALSVNYELLALYWHIGKNIVERQQTEGWGTAVIDRLGKDLQTAFPGISGFSRPNVYRMRAFYYPGTEEAHTNPTCQRGECLRALAGASG